jgi:hypothetical protein
MIANLYKNPVNNTPVKRISNSNENTLSTSRSSPVSQLLKKDSSEVNDQLNSGSKSLKSIQFFEENANYQNNPTNSRALNSSPSSPPIQRKGSTDHSPKAAVSANKTGLPDNVKSGVEQLSGVSLSDVKVHYNSPKPAQLHAHAYAQGTDIHVASGQEKHVPHEAWHVVQQKQGRVQATKQMKGEVPVNDDAGLEKEADVMGAKAVQMAAKENGGVVQQVSASNKAVAQLGMFDWMKSMYKGAKRMLGFGGEEKKKGDSTMSESQMGKGDIIQDNEVLSDRNAITKNDLAEDELELMEREKDKNIIPKGKVEGIKNGIVVADGEKGEVDYDRKNDLEKLLSKNVERNKFIGVKGGQANVAKLTGADKAQHHLGLKYGKTGKPKATFKESLNELDSKKDEYLRFDELSSVSVLLEADKGGLSDNDKKTIIKINSEFMDLIKEGMVINKIIPDFKVVNLLKSGNMNTDSKKEVETGKKADGSNLFNNAIQGSAADKNNYDDGLTGAEAVSNFGLDYGAYKDKKINPDGSESKVKLEGNKEVADYTWGGLSSYVREVAPDNDGKELKAVKNVFYVDVKLPRINVDNVKVPIHQNIIDFAEKELNNLNNAIPNLADPSEAKESLKIIQKFLSRAQKEDNMTVSTLLDGTKNPDDPLTNLGMTKPSARLQTSFGTINQEFYLPGAINLDKDSGLWLKDSTGNDQKVGVFEEVNGKILFRVTNELTLNAALEQNKSTT